MLGCTSGAGQSVIALMTGHTLAAARAVPVAALDLNPGDTSLAARIEPATSVTALLAGRGPTRRPHAGSGPAAVRAAAGPGAGWTSSPATAPAPSVPEDYQRLAACWPSATR